MIRVAVTGGIGSGKSTVCRIFAEKGVAVYDSDSRAKHLMEHDATLREQVCSLFGAQSYDAAGRLNRSWVAKAVFGDEQQRRRLDAVVHPAVARDFEQWCREASGAYVILESAILFESGFDALVDVKIAVLAPVPLRLERACLRDKVPEEAVRCRMAAQLSDEELLGKVDYTIVNINLDDVRHDVEDLDARLRARAQREAARP